MLLDENNTGLIWWNHATQELKFLNSVAFRTLLLPKYFGKASFASFSRYLNKNGFRKTAAFGKGRREIPDDQIRQFILKNPNSEALMARTSAGFAHKSLKAESRETIQIRNNFAAGQRDGIVSLFGYSSVTTVTTADDYAFPLEISTHGSISSGVLYATPEELMKEVERDFN